MKNRILKLLLLDDHTLIHRAKLIGIIHIVSALSLMMFISVLQPTFRKASTTFHQDIASVDPKALANISLEKDADAANMWVVLVYAPELPRLFDLTTAIVNGLGFIVSICMLFCGIVYLRYNRIIKNMNPNQRLEPIVTTPVESGNVQGTQAHP